MILSQLHLQPETLDDAQWAHQLRMAEYLEYRYFENLSKLFKA